MCDGVAGEGPAREERRGGRGGTRRDGAVEAQAEPGRPCGDGDPDGARPAFGVGAGIAAAVRCALARPARLGDTRLVAVDGPSGSGKTSLAGPLARALAVAIGGDVIRPERYSDVRDCATERFSAREASHSASPPVTRGDTRGALVTVVSTDLLATWERPLEWWPTLDEHLLGPLAAGSTATMPVVEWVSGSPRPGGGITVPPVDVLVLEGVSSGRRAVADRLSALVWIEIADPARRLERAVARDGEGMRPYLARWQADEDAHFAADATRDRADVVIAADHG